MRCMIRFSPVAETSANYRSRLLVELYITRWSRKIKLKVEYPYVPRGEKKYIGTLKFKISEVFKQYHRQNLSIPTLNVLTKVNIPIALHAYRIKSISSVKTKR